MKRVLIAKELAAMRPFLFLLAALLLLTLWDSFSGTVTDSLNDIVRPGGWEWRAEAGFTLLLGFALGSGMIAREQEEGTLDFLDGLPLGRGTVFVHKLLVAVGCIFLYCLIGPLLALGLTGALRTSADLPVGGAALATLAGRFALLAAQGVALGLLCGGMRQLSWLVLAMLGMLVALLERHWPRVGSALDPTRLVAGGWAQQSWDGELLATSIAVTVLCLGLAWLLFREGGTGRLHWLANLGDSRALLVALWVLAIGLFLAVAYYSREPAQAGSDDRVAGAAADASPRGARTPVRIATVHYRFMGPAGTGNLAALTAGADAAFRHASALLALDPAKQQPIDVDLSGSVRHTAGLASLDRIRMNVDADWTDTLVHETVHVLALRLAGGERADALARMGLFNEGLARWSEPGRRRSAALRERDEYAAAILMRRRLLSNALLLDPAALERDLDWEMIYPLGALFVDTLVTRHGAQAPARVLATLADPQFPRDLYGEPLYRVAFQLAGYDLAGVMFDYSARLKDLASRHAAAIDALPQPRGLLVQGGDKAGISLKLDRPLARNQRLIVRFRPDADSDMYEYTVVSRLDRRGPQPVAWLPLDQVAGGQVCFQPGVVIGMHTVYSAWSCLPLGAAAPIAERQQ